MVSNGCGHKLWVELQIISSPLKRDLRYCYGEFQSENNSSLSRFQNGWIEMSFDSKPTGISRFRTIAKGCPTTSNLTSIGPKRRVNHIYTFHAAVASEEDHQSQRSAQKVASGRLHNISIHTNARGGQLCTQIQPRSTLKVHSQERECSPRTHIQAPLTEKRVHVCST